jgi:putative Holliday junction resolvase
MQVRILGLDLGDKTIGVAVSDALGYTAQGLKVIRRQNLANDLKELNKIIADYQIGKIVVGLPRNMDGSIGPQAKKVYRFIELLREEFGLPIISLDERLTTKAAEAILLEGDLRRAKRKRVIDKIAASIILQGYLDSIRVRK